MSDDLGKLLGELQAAKAAEQTARLHRISVEEKIVACVEGAPESGSRTLGEKGGLRATVKFGLSYKADVAAIRALDVDPEVLPLKFVPSKWELDGRAYEALSESHPKVFARVAACVERKASKPSVELKL